MWGPGTCSLGSHPFPFNLIYTGVSDVCGALWALGPGTVVPPVLQALISPACGRHVTRSVSVTVEMNIHIMHINNRHFNIVHWHSFFTNTGYRWRRAGRSLRLIYCYNNFDHMPATRNPGNVVQQLEQKSRVRNPGFYFLLSIH